MLFHNAKFSLKSYNYINPVPLCVHCSLASDMYLVTILTSFIYKKDFTKIDALIPTHAHLKLKT